jgi:succinate dehydrogenase/fumarate reductase cytochrome b subunit
MTKSEWRMPKEYPNDEIRNYVSILSDGLLSFVIRASLLIRHSIFGIRHFLAESRHSQIQRMAAMMSATQLTPIEI